MLRQHNDVTHNPPADWATRGVIIAWLVALAGSWVVLARYERNVNQPLRAGLAEHWPSQTALARSTDQFTLVFFLHPKCPCSRASLWELGKVFDELGRSSERTPELIVVATVPENADDGWTETNTIREAQKLPNARLFVDRGGIEAARFGANTSGFVMLFNESSDRVYAGGITVARAHEGANAGRDALTQILQGRRASAPENPAFGCRLCLPEQALPPVAATFANPPGSTIASARNDRYSD